MCAREMHLVTKSNWHACGPLRAQMGAGLKTHPYWVARLEASPLAGLWASGIGLK